MMLKLILTLLLLIGVACDSLPTAHNYVAVGTVRNIWCRAYCSVNFEHDNGVLQVLTFSNEPPPPVWAGLHCKLIYNDNGYNIISDLVKVERQ